MSSYGQEDTDDGPWEIETWQIYIIIFIHGILYDKGFLDK
jgi:hypothetical protein